MKKLSIIKSLVTICLLSLSSSAISAEVLVASSNKSPKVKLESASILEDFTTLNYKGTPGVSFCVAYSESKGVMIQNRTFIGRTHFEDTHFCGVLNKEGKVSDTIHASGSDGLLIVNIIEVDQSVSTYSVHYPKAPPTARELRIKNRELKNKKELSVN